MVDFAWAAQLLPLMAAGFAVGLLVGLTGVGGGALMTPLLISSFGVAPPVAVGTPALISKSCLPPAAGIVMNAVSK